MRKRNKLFTLFVLLITAMLLLSSCTANALETAKKKKNTAVPVVTEAPAQEPVPTEPVVAEAPAAEVNVVEEVKKEEISNEAADQLAE